MAIKVNLIDIHNRELATRTHIDESSNILQNDIYERTMESQSPAIIENAIGKWRSLDSDEYRAFDKALDLFEHSAEVSTQGMVEKNARVLAEATIKLRDGKQTAEYIKRKLSRFKTKSTSKTSKKLADLNDTLKSKLPTINFSKSANEQVAEDCYEMMLDKALVYEQCDRILRNDRKISKRYNLDKIAYYSESVEDFVNEVCELVDTYSFPYYGKYSVAIENSIYTLYKNHSEFNIQDVVEAATSYYLMKDITPEYVGGISKVLRENKLLKDEDLSCVDYVLHPRTNAIKESIDNIIDGSYYGSSLSLALGDNEYRNYLEASTKKISVKDMINDFKLLPNKSVEAFKKLIPKFFTLTEKEIVEGIPSFFTVVRTFFVLGSFAINPVIGLVTAFGSKLLTIHMGRSNVPHAIDHYKKEIKKVEDKLKKANGEKKERLEKYHHSLKYDLEKLERYYDSIRTEKEKEDDFASDDDFSDDEFMEAVIDLGVMAKLAESIDISVLENCAPLVRDTLKISDQLANAYSICVSTLIDDYVIRESIIDNFNNQYLDLKESGSFDGESYAAIEYTRNAKALLEMPHSMDMTDDVIYNINYLNALYELCDMADLLKESADRALLEDTSFTNKLKLSAEKLKKQAANLSDKEKMMSKTIDGSMESLRRSIERSLTTDNREAIIKGQVVPSASKIIKMAITGAVAWAINPALAVIGAIGAFGVSKHLSSKERQLLLDEINIELEMCDKYLKIADEKDDMKATRELLQIQKRLQREKARITYKAKYKYNDNVATTTKDKD